MSFISGIWFPLDGAPHWVVTIAHVFPLYHIVNAFDACFVAADGGRRLVGPTTCSRSPAWTAAACVVATRRLRRELEAD
jgi:ABC-2 type transport system permease protein